MFCKLQGLFPPRPDPEVTQYALLQETRDIPTEILQRALGRLSRSEQFLPTVAQIRSAAANYVRERHRAAAGLEPKGDLPRGGIDVERWLSRGRNEPLPALPAQSVRLLQAPEPKASPEERQIAQKRLAAAVDSIMKKAKV